MNLTTLIATILLISTNPAFAAGSHEGGHGHSNSDQHGHSNEHASPIGSPASANPENRQITVQLKDSMRFEFEPELTSLKEGQTVTFVVINDGKIPHEFSIGNAEEQQAHMAMMKNAPNMTHHDNTTVSLAPGEQAEMSWLFSGNDQVVFSCNIPGHFEAGMRHEANIL